EPGDRPDIETNLAPGEMIEAFIIPSGPWPRSLYVKVRDRESYEFAASSAAVARAMDGPSGSSYRAWRPSHGAVAGPGGGNFPERKSTRRRNRRSCCCGGLRGTKTRPSQSIQGG